MSTKPLHGVRIVDLTRLLPGPMCTLHLADMGADVIKIEDTKMGDYARSIPPMQKKNSSFFLAVNRNKRSVALDLAKEEGRQVFLKLSETADVIVESFRPGVVKKLGIDYETIKKVNPKIIYCSISGYGQTGPYRDKAGHDLNYCSNAGIIKPVGSRQLAVGNRQTPVPSIPNFQIGDIVGGSLNAAMGILAALIQQKTTGVGQYIDVSIFDGVLAHSVTALAHLKSIERLGFDTSDMLNGALHCYNIYETKDSRYIALAALEFKFWERFCEAVGRDDLTDSHMVSGDEAEKVYKELSELFKTKTLEQWMDHFKDIDCCISPVLSLSETIKNEQVVARNTVVIKEHPEEGDVIQFSLPLKFSSFEFEIKKPAPLHGEHTEEVLADLGYSKRKIEEWKIKNII
ncbi:MAG: CoA transferase [Cytophagales bacterium]|nr:CoA transferase [Cytophagales bacterium]